MEQTTGRTGITFEQVATVADAITAKGDRPTLRGVRIELGSGSMGTIQKHLASWQGQRRQIVISSASLPTEIQRVIISEIEREIAAARAELDIELAAAKGDRDTLADDNEAQAELISQQTARLIEIEATSQQQAGRITQLEVDLSTAWEATARERGVAEQARQALAKTELRLEALPKVEADVERLRAALESSQVRAVAAEQLAAVIAEKLAGVDVRLADAQARETQTAEKLAAVMKDLKTTTGRADESRYLLMAAERKAHDLVNEVKAATARAAAAEQLSVAAECKVRELVNEVKAATARAAAAEQLSGTVKTL